ncbi:unnamed protein product [Clavelina lepadiformis]|uniref:Uncharacterized protein n=1 Tax=Clavelina lepadiformis TaxID=159417 RepID=A0ABP0F547_CLALP
MEKEGLKTYKNNVYKQIIKMNTAYAAALVRSVARFSAEMPNQMRSQPRCIPCYVYAECQFGIHSKFTNDIMPTSISKN